MNLLPRHRSFDFDSIFNDFFSGVNMPSLKGHASDTLAGMRVDVHENSDNYQIHADLPGVKKDDISITLENNVLTVAASKRTEAEEKASGKVIWRERSSGSITRSFNVSPGISEKDIKAQFDDGVLTLTVPRGKPDEETESAKRIPIK